MHPENAHFYLYGVCTGASLLVGILVLKLLKYPKEEHGVRAMSLLPVIVGGAIVGAKAPVILSYGWHPEFWWTGKSYFGALLGAFVLLNIYKRLKGLSGQFGDRFVPSLCFSAAFGKMGCLLNGCCGGIATDSFLGVHNHAGRLTFPVQLYESIFQFACGVLFIGLYRKGKLHGAHFVLYMIVYMCFRFMIEFIRTEPRLLFGFSIYQLMALIFLPIFFAIYLRRIQSAE